jgi:hypothetical protein
MRLKSRENVFYRATGRAAVFGRPLRGRTLQVLPDPAVNRAAAHLSLRTSAGFYIASRHEDIDSRRIVVDKPLLTSMADR